jgi:hypothetical protein
MRSSNKPTADQSFLARFVKGFAGIAAIAAGVVRIRQWRRLK